MEYLQILAHPDKNSFQASLAEEIRNYLEKEGHTVQYLNLYEEDFPALLPVEEIRRGSSAHDLVLQHQRHLKESGRLLLFYPDWWGLPPAILKGWLDRVLAPGVAFLWEGEDFLDKEWVPLLEGKMVDIYLSADGSLDGDWLKTLWSDRIFGPCGASVTIHFLDRMHQRDFSERKEWISRQCSTIL